MPELSAPDVRFRESYLAALREYHADGRPPRYQQIDYAAVERDFAGYVAERLSLAQEIVGRVPQVELWLTEGDEYIGRVTIRTRLNPRLMQMGGHIGYDIRPSRRGQGFGRQILRLALPIARELGVTRALLTCDADNLPSQRIIEGCGGVLQDQIDVKGHQQPIRRYWIENGG